ncbi:hypothetical protein C2E23DRAFT_885028 [Lenzites betulinus]|nr:hypothetical protein C2E23DRAFT_885028 [Lenzites betulinus]
MSVPSPAQYLSDLARFKEGIGAWLIGTFISTLVVGMVLQQAFRYFRLYPSDPLYMKAWVIIAVLLDLLTTAFSMHVAYYYLVTYYLNPAVFTRKDVWTSAFVTIFGPLNNLAAECFFARRVWMIGRRYRLVAVSAMIMILASCGFYFTVAQQAFALANIEVAADTGAWLPSVSAALLLGSDLQLTAVLVFFLHGNRTGLKRTNSMVDILIAYTMSTGALVCVLNVVSLSITFTHNIIYAAATLVVKSVYTSSFLAALNTRQMIRARGELDEDSDIGGGIIFGEKVPENGPVRKVEHPLTSEVVFARSPLRTQDTETGISTHSGDDSEKRSPGSMGGDSDLKRRGAFGTATV